jgi:hypothetical protein
MSIGTQAAAVRGALLRHGPVELQRVRYGIGLVAALLNLGEQYPIFYGR